MHNVDSCITHNKPIFHNLTVFSFYKIISSTNANYYPDNKNS